MNTPYSRNYPGGMEAFLTLFEQAFTEYNQIKYDQARDEGFEFIPMADADKIQRVSAQLGYVPGTHSIIRSAEAHCRNNPPYGFAAYTQFLRGELQRANFYLEDSAKSQSNMRVRRQHSNMTINDSQLTEQTIGDNELLLLNMTSNRLFPQYNLPKELYECIPREARREFTVNRNALQERNKTSDKYQNPTNQETPKIASNPTATDKQDQQAVPPQPMPKQYGNRTANLSQNQRLDL